MGKIELLRIFIKFVSNVWSILTGFYPSLVVNEIAFIFPQTFLSLSAYKNIVKCVSSVVQYNLLLIRTIYYKLCSGLLHIISFLNFVILVIIYNLQVWESEVSWGFNSAFVRIMPAAKNMTDRHVKNIIPLEFNISFQSKTPQCKQKIIQTILCIAINNTLSAVKQSKHKHCNTY